MVLNFDIVLWGPEIFEHVFCVEDGTDLDGTRNKAPPQNKWDSSTLFTTAWNCAAWHLWFMCLSGRVRCPSSTIQKSNYLHSSNLVWEQPAACMFGLLSYFKEYTNSWVWTVTLPDLNECQKSESLKHRVSGQTMQSNQTTIENGTKLWYCSRGLRSSSMCFVLKTVFTWMER